MPRPGVLDRPVALFNVLVVLFDRFLRHLARMQVVVVKVGDYVRIQVVLAFAVKPQFGESRHDDEIPNRHCDGKREIRIVDRGVKKSAPPLLNDCTVVNLAWVELLQQELVPGVRFLRRVTLRPFGSQRAVLTSRDGSRRRPVLREPGLGPNQKGARRQLQQLPSCHAQNPPAPCLGGRDVGAGMGLLKRRLAPTEPSRECRNRG